jgi:hypothetical protein
LKFQRFQTTSHHRKHLHNIKFMEKVGDCDSIFCSTQYAVQCRSRAREREALKEHMISQQLHIFYCGIVKYCWVMALKLTIGDWNFTLRLFFRCYSVCLHLVHRKSSHTQCQDVVAMKMTMMMELKEFVIYLTFKKPRIPSTSSFCHCCTHKRL